MAARLRAFPVPVKPCLRFARHVHHTLRWRDTMNAQEMFVVSVSAVKPLLTQTAHQIVVALALLPVTEHGGAQTVPFATVPAGILEALIQRRAMHVETA